eukprot:TRINITY_DN299_c0_g1_i1.p1 TRINITY_DN299_c0_g1~~TRINITY_DN299_c0_g1_i1.p1  ORF type:complete len:241 (+),score=55.14 TRINITY_DN299_c0_g1_i1:64-723(+)
MSIKIVYFPMPGRAEPTRLALTLGGVSFEDEHLTGEQWGKMKSEVSPKQLPLLHVGERVFGQSYAQLRYASKISKFEGRPLYPTDPLLALEVDEFADMMTDLFAPIAASFKMTDTAERDALRAKSVAEGGDVHKWLSFIDTQLGKSKSGFAVGDYLTMADVIAFCFIQPLRAGLLDGVPTTCLDGFKNIQAHRDMIANIPIVKAYYAGEPKTPVYKIYQ